MFRGKLIGVFRFSRRGEYIGGRAASRGGPGAHTRPWRGQGWPAPWGGISGRSRILLMGMPDQNFDHSIGVFFVIQ
jgi:hypothetical protein